jgi:hypothetical protein
MVHKMIYNTIKIPPLVPTDERSHQIMQTKEMDKACGSRAVMKAEAIVLFQRYDE